MTKLIYPTSPQAPKFLLKFALSHAFKSTSSLLFTSVVGMWVISLLSYVVQMHLDGFRAALIVNAITLLLIILFALVGVIQCNALYSHKKISDQQAIKTMLSKVWIIILTIASYVSIWLLIVWFSSDGLQLLFKPASVYIGVARIFLGFLYLFFLTATFFLLPLQMITKKKTSQLIRELLHVGTSHWLRCFLCFFSWIVIIALLTGNFAFIILPWLMTVPFAMLVIKSVVVVLAVPVLISYTTLLAHDIDLRAA